MTLDVPVGVRVLRVIFGIATNLGLFEAPLWQDDVISLKPAPQCLVLEPHACCERVNDIFSIHFRGMLCVFNNVKNPMIITVANGIIPIAANFALKFGHRSRNGMGVEHASRWDVLQANSRLIREIANVRRIKV